MSLYLPLGILLPFFGTTLGSAAVFFTRKRNFFVQSGVLSGFSAGVMIAACVWSLIIPAVEMSEHLRRFAFLPMLCGLWAGALFLLLAENLLSRKNTRIHDKNFLFFLAVILHNIPEGMAVGIAFAMAVSNNSKALFVSALILSLGVTIQNIPEGAIMSVPYSEKGTSLYRSFLFGSLSGLPEPVFALVTLLFSSASAVILPYLLGFAAGAMIYVSVKELIPEAKGVKGCICFLSGFSVMMVLDIALG